MSANISPLKGSKSFVSPKVSTGLGQNPFSPSTVNQINNYIGKVKSRERPSAIQKDPRVLSNESMFSGSERG
jgi:hypothetical protein